jgi:1,5-anhydro-D-fructose reductase (1,5-anhydro-D-mannitol-forming)
MLDVILDFNACPHPEGETHVSSETPTPVRWGIIGTGWVASDFIAPAMVNNDSSQLAACLGSSVDKGKAFAERFGVERVHGDLASIMHDPDVDAVYIALPNAMHYEAVLEAARGGKHVLCEKPFAMSVAHARDMVEACQQAGVVLRIAHQIRLDAAVARAREIVRSGRLGHLAAISLERASGLAVRTPWREEVSQSGVIFDVGVHLLDLIQWVSGQQFAEVSAFTHPDRRLGQPDDTVTVLGRLDGDCHAVARATREVASAENNLIIEGSEATLVTSGLRFASEHIVRVRDADGTTEERFAASPAYACEVLAFEGELRGKRSSLPDGQNSLQMVAVTQAVLQAIEARRVVAVAAVG